MDALIGLLFSLPSIVVAGIIGAIGGALGGLIGAGLERVGIKGAARWLPIIAIIATISATQGVILPALRNSEWASCYIAEDAAKTTNAAQGGTAIDNVTTFKTMDVDCAHRAVTYHMQADLDAAQITDADWNLVFTDFNTKQCANADWRAFLDRGWTIANAYDFTTGDPRRMEAKC